MPQSEEVKKLKEVSIPCPRTSATHVPGLWGDRRSRRFAVTCVDGDANVECLQCLSQCLMSSLPGSSPSSRTRRPHAAVGLGKSLASAIDSRKAVELC